MFRLIAALTAFVAGIFTGSTIVAFLDPDPDWTGPLTTDPENPQTVTVLLDDVLDDDDWAEIVDRLLDGPDHPRSLP